MFNLNNQNNKVNNSKENRRDQTRIFHLINSQKYHLKHTSVK